MTQESEKEKHAGWMLDVFSQRVDVNSPTPYTNSALARCRAFGRPKKHNGHAVVMAQDMRALERELTAAIKWIKEMTA